MANLFPNKRINHCVFFIPCKIIPRPFYEHNPPIVKNDLRKIRNQYFFDYELLDEKRMFKAGLKFSQKFLLSNLIHTFAKNKAKRPFGL